MEYQRKIEYRALAKDILCVAVEGSVKDWTTYVGAVVGNNHSEEWREVKDNGAKLPQEVAEILFPSFKKFRWRA